MSDQAIAVPKLDKKADSTLSTAALSDYQSIAQMLQLYIDGSRTGNSELMRPAFYTGATLVGHVAGELMFAPIQMLYDWIDGNGPAPDIEPDIASIEILNTVAIARVEIKEWSGKMVGSGVHMSDLFNFIKTNDGWRISQKLFHWHGQKA